MMSKEDDNGGSRHIGQEQQLTLDCSSECSKNTQNCIHAFTSTQQDNLNGPQLNSLRMYGQKLQVYGFPGFPWESRRPP